ncbi:unnamed protein product [Symbiodinium sp. CCMP2592]|nr:unnamed protein product [Symbiodinium sp. CCMP2592]
MRPILPKLQESHVQKPEDSQKPQEPQESQKPPEPQESQKPQLSQKPSIPETANLASPCVEVLKSPSARGSKRPHPPTPAVTPTKPVPSKSAASQKAANEAQSDDDDEEAPKVLNFNAMTKLEREKVRRIVSPKKATGKLEVPENIFEMWKDAGKGRDTLFRMWSRIEKIVAWATKRNLVRTCEYDDETLEYWVNTRTTGTMTKEDLEMLERQQTYSGEGGDELNFKPGALLDGFSFSDDDGMVHNNEKQLEGDHHMSVASQMKEYMKQVLKSKGSLESFVEKIKPTVAGDAKANQTLKKMDVLIKDFENLYEEMTEARAEGSTTGYSDKSSGGSFHTWVCEGLCVPAKDLVLDARCAASKDPCKVLAQISKVQVSSADAPLFEIFLKNGMCLPIEFSWAKAGMSYRYPFLKPKGLLEALSDHGYFHRVLGVPVDLASEALDLFWQKFKGLYPQHDLFHNSENLQFGKLIPYYLHGDGGRGFKKDPIEILSMFPALGSGSRKRPVSLSSKRPAESEIELGINLLGNSGATRFLFSVLGSLVAKKDGTVFDDLMELWSQELKSLFDDGFEAEGSTWRVVILGFTGDSPFVKKVAKTMRSFHNVRKNATSRNLQKGCCWLCHAGFESPETGVCIPFEHLGLTQPAWLQTCRVNNPLPWNGSGGAIVRHMLLDRADTPAAFFRADFFHVYHAGVGLDFSASALIYMMKTLYGLGSVAKDLEALNADLKRWMTRTKNRLHCGRLTEDLLGYSGTREYPEGKWSKNMDTAVIMKFIVYLLERPEFQQQVQGDDLLREILAAAQAIGQVNRTSLQAEYFMSSEDTRIIVDCGHKFLLGFMGLVSMCHQRSLCLFKLRPKAHYLNHIFLRVYEEWKAHGYAVNPYSEATFMSEDFVGRTARLSRRVSARAVAIKTMQRYLLHMKTALDKEAFSMMDVSMLV